MTKISVLAYFVDLYLKKTMLGLALIMEQSALRHLRLRNYSARMRGEGGGTG
jgi:hypothetical protein